jgi:hypothetical protein
MKELDKLMQDHQQQQEVAVAMSVSRKLNCVLNTTVTHQN